MRQNHRLQHKLQHGNQVIIFMHWLEIIVEILESNVLHEIDELYRAFAKIFVCLVRSSAPRSLSM
jgi:hypothetical protein